MVSFSSVVATLSITLALTACVDQSTEHRVRANAFFRGGEFASAVKECDDGLAAKPDDVATLILRGKALFEMGRADDAKKDFDHAVELGAGHGKTYVGDAYLGLAIIASRSKDWATAKDEVQKGLAVADGPGVAAWLGSIALDTGDEQLARKAALAAVSFSGWAREEMRRKSPPSAFPAWRMAPVTAPVRLAAMTLAIPV